MHELFAILGLLPWDIRRRVVEASADEIERRPWKTRKGMREIAPVREHNAALKKVVPPIPDLDHQTTLLDRIFSKKLLTQVLLQCVRSCGSKAQLIPLDSFERETPLFLTEVDVLLRQLLVEKLYCHPKQLLEIVPFLLELLPLLLLR